MKIPPRNEIYVERRSLDEFDVDTTGTPGNVVMEWLDDMAELRYVLDSDAPSEDAKDWEDTLLDIMNNIWYLCAAVVRQPRAYLHIEEYQDLLMDLYAPTPYSYRPDATLAAACMLLEKTGSKRGDIVRFCTKIRNAPGQYLADKDMLHDVRNRAWRITTGISLDDFTCAPPAQPADVPQLRGAAAAYARNLRIGELAVRLELANRRLAEAEAEKQALAGRLAACQKQAAAGATDALGTLVDRALSLSDEKGLKDLSLWLTSMGQPALTQPYTQRIVRRMEELKTPVPRTQHIYHAGSNHISESRISGVSIGTAMPAGRSLPHE